MVPHGGVLVGGEQAVAGLHASNSHCPLSRLTGHKHWLLVRLLWHRNLLQGEEEEQQVNMHIKQQKTGFISFNSSILKGLSNAIKCK